MEATPVNNENVFLCRKANVWYTMADGDWYNPNVWAGNVLDKKQITMPQPGDTVFINHQITYSIGALGLNHVFINGSLVFGNGNYSLTVNGNLQGTGKLDMGNGAGTLTLNGYNNYLHNFVAGSTSTIIYAAPYDQPIMPLTYANLSIIGNSSSISKYLTGDTMINGNLQVNGASLQLGAYNSTVNGATNVQFNGGLLKNAAKGLALFAGNVFIAVNSSWNFSGNGNVEFRNGWSWGNDDYGYFYTGTGTYTFSTNDQTISRTYPYVVQSTFKCTVKIAGITLTLGDAANQVFLLLNNGSNGIDGTNANSKLVQYNAIVVQTSLTMPMANFGSYNYFVQGAVNSAIGFNLSTNYTLPNLQYPGLILAGAGKASAQANLVCNGLAVYSFLEMGSYHLTSTQGLYVAIGATLSKTGPGNLLCGGQAIIENNANVSLSGNPSMEFRNGLRFGNAGLSDPRVDLGTGPISFSTNNQVIESSYPGSAYNFRNNVSINGIVLTLQGFNTTAIDLLFTGSLNGTNAASNLVINAAQIARFANAIAPMQNGSLIANAGSNVYYQLNGNQDVKAGNYGNLTLSTGGVKRLLGNVWVKNTYALLAPATLNTNGFNLTNP